MNTDNPRNHFPDVRYDNEIEEALRELDPETTDLLSTPPVKTLTNVYIGRMDTLSWGQDCHSTGNCSSDVWVDTETTLHLFEDEDCDESAGLVAIYNGDRVGNNAALLSTAQTAYLAKAPVSLHYVDSKEPYARGHGRLRAVIRMWFSQCDPCGCEG